MLRVAWKSVRHDWRRYLPAVICVSVSGLLMIMQLALMLGAFRNVSAPLSMSSALLWAGPAEETSFDSGTSLQTPASSLLWLIPEVERVEPFALAFSTMSLPVPPGETTIPKEHFIQVVGTSIKKDAMLFGDVISPALRESLAEPGTVILDKVVAGVMGVGIGDNILVQSKMMRVVGVLDGLRGVMMSTVLTSQATARSLPGQESVGVPNFILVGLAPDAPAGTVDRLITEFQTHPDLRLWKKDELITSTMEQWALKSAIGVIFLSSIGIALIVTLLVVSQSLSAAVGASIREYAALRAYGFSYRRLQRLVLAQGGIVGIAALGVTGLVATLLIGYLQGKGVAVFVTVPLVLWSACALMACVFVSNLIALRRLRKADPAALLR
ncbi:putative ABC transport system permease protein [Sulfitobacter undariae]|uniref:Putative ABC transport system permease protein n=1 Tax=Sulfitobacter undariae TaxID=1563671 RepID=A0A7W6H0Z9_9RHOB|nr:ABC transporter permease [Sulfitobacter undariae]MBB3994607.1 putative ABC transport system permease protein [Sulfitobacter undariae]